VDFSQIPVWIVDDVSILYGGSSLAEGSGALGGAVLLENSGEAGKGRFLSLNQEISSFGTLGTQGSLSAGDGKVRTVTRMYWNRSLNDYPFLNKEIRPVEVHRLKGAGYEKGGVLQELYIHPGNRQDLSVQLWYHEGERDIPPLMSYEGPAREEKQADRNLRTSAEWKFHPGILTLSLRSGFADSRIHYLFNPGYLQTETKSREQSLYNTVQAGLRAGSALSLHLRAEYNRHDAGISDIVSHTGYSHKRNEGGVTASARVRPGRGLVLYVLLRQDWADGTGLPLMPSAGLSYKTGDKTSLCVKGNLARNYNLPSLNDLYWVPGGNPGLKPENSLNADLSVEMLRAGRRSSLKAYVNVFAADVRDWILWKPTHFWYWEAENIAHVFSRGADLQLGSDFYLGEWILSMKTGYAYTRSTNEGAGPGNDLSRGRQLIYIPLHTSSSQLYVTRRGYFMAWSLCTTGKRFTQPDAGEYDGTEPLDPYLLVDLNLGKSWKAGPGRAGMRFSVYNLLNVSYEAVRSRPMPMRSFAITLQLEL
jgi:outer membrane cobalamin receptor